MQINKLFYSSDKLTGCVDPDSLFFIILFYSSALNLKQPIYDFESGMNILDVCDTLTY